MLFNSYLFVFIFFPLCLLGYYGLLYVKKPEAARIFLTLMSLWFYGYFNLSYLLIMVGSILFNYIFHPYFMQYSLIKLRRRICMETSIPKVGSSKNKI